MEGLTEGRLVHYVAYNSTHLAALVIRALGDKANLVTFSDMPNVNGDTNFSLGFMQNVPYSDTKEPGTFHWIERV